MAILIPSKDIYNITNSKIIDNFIDKIEVQATNITPNNDYNTTVYNENIDITTNKSEEVTEDTQYADTNYISSTNQPTYVRVASTSKTTSSYTTINEIKILKTKDNKFIKKIYNNEDGIKATVSCTLQEYDIAVSYSPQENKFTFDNNKKSLKNEKTIYGFNTINYTNDITLNEEYPSITVSLNITETNDEINSSATIEGSYTVWGTPTINATSKSQANTSLINIANVIVEETNDYYLIKNIKILIGLKVDLGYAWIELIQPMSETGALGSPTNIRAVEIEAILQKLELTIYGDTIGIDLTEKTIVIGNENGDYSLSIDNNELLQTGNYYKDNNTNAINKEYKNTLTAYENGKETATLLCAIDDYYNVTFGTLIDIVVIQKVVLPNVVNANHYNIQSDNVRVNDVLKYGEYEATVQFRVKDDTYDNIYRISVGTTSSSDDWGNAVGYTISAQRIRNTKDNVEYVADTPILGEKAIAKDGSKPMTFNIGDIVVPYIYSANSKDIPMSRTLYEEPKKFRVVEVKYSFNGAVWQELTLQES